MWPAWLLLELTSRLNSFRVNRERRFDLPEHADGADGQREGTLASCVRQCSSETALRWETGGATSVAGWRLTDAAVANKDDFEQVVVLLLRCTHLRTAAADSNTTRRCRDDAPVSWRSMREAAVCK